MRLVVTLCVAVTLLTAPGAASAAPEGPVTGVGSKVAFHGLGAVPNFPYSSPYEDLKLKTTK